jgi:hypothetical protein
VVEKNDAFADAFGFVSVISASIAAMNCGGAVMVVFSELTGMHEVFQRRAGRILAGARVRVNLDADAITYEARACWLVNVYDAVFSEPVMIFSQLYFHLFR